MTPAIASAIMLLAAVQESYAAPDYARSGREMPIRYPGPTRPGSQERYTTAPAPAPHVPASCANSTFCTVRPDDYPEDAVHRLFNNTKQFRGAELELTIDDIGNRQGDPNEEDNCQSIVSYEPIYRLKDGNRWQNVVQAPKLEYEQKVRLEKCSNPDAECFTGAGVRPLGIRTFCKQKFSTWTLQVMDENNKPFLKQIDLPSCCSCHYEKTD